MNKHLTSIKKRQEDDGSHTHTHRTEHLRKMTRRGQHSTPKHKLRGQKGTKKKDLGTKRRL